MLDKLIKKFLTPTYVKNNQGVYVLNKNRKENLNFVQNKTLAVIIPKRYLLRVFFKKTIVSCRGAPRGYPQWRTIRHFKIVTTTGTREGYPYKLLRNFEKFADYIQNKT